MKKIKEMILHILNKKPGLTWDEVLFILFRADREWYGHNGKPMFKGIKWIKTKTGVKFVKK